VLDRAQAFPEQRDQASRGRRARSAGPPSGSEPPKYLLDLARERAVRLLPRPSELFHQRIVRPRINVVRGEHARLPSGGLDLRLQPFEVFATLGKSGGFFAAKIEAICRLISLALRSGIAITEIIDQLKGIRGPDIIFANGGTIHSLPDAIGQVLENHIKRGQTELGLKFTEERNPQVGASEMVGSAEVKESISKVGNGHTEVTSIANLGHAPACPDCGNMLMMAEDCLKCDLCGFSKCG